MADSISNKEIYTLLLSLKEEVKQLTVHIRALRKEAKGESVYVKKE